ncbi:hypothetical protein [Paraburkholderia megapolitana]|uniref:Immunity protein 30 n=1 Tax=Paraburkholderia megapolitana TaxID=420953 RepID=A0A1I3VYQ5_9BURK|nr:hypothetical protein [Paraburkholderia megapolitana]QDQ82186.1 hypothetical protein FNZ07_12850 [Paraburkholderia megapolitana]SFK00355.1 hypothetical protein SAMN05192543_11551 [Paraburkholderia megapolitana]
MNRIDLINQLAAISQSDDIIELTAALIDSLSSSSPGVEMLDPILRFMESHPDWDFGLPGPLVHFVEKFYRRGYEEELLKSVQRRPTAHTAWMLNRIINGEKDAITKAKLIGVMQNASQNPSIDSATLERINHFLSLHQQ